MRHDRHQPLPDPLKIPKESSLHQGVYGSNLLYPVEALAPALACPANDPTRLHSVITSLYKSCAIRFGIPSDAPRSTQEAMELPRNSSLRYGPRNEVSDARWERLARSLEVTEPGGPISIRALSPEAMSAIACDARDLAAMFKNASFSPISAPVVDAFTTIADELRANSRHTSENIKKLITKVSESAYRQLRIAVELGPEWTLVTPEERMVLASCAARHPRRPSEICRTEEDEKPSDSLLAPLNLTWFWKEARGAWEPVFKSSGKRNSSLFDQSATYFSKLLEKDVARTWNPHTITFLKRLEAARDEFQLARHKDPDSEPALRRALLARQNALLDELLDREHTGPTLR